MRRTLLLIPHEIAGIPVFGLGWVLIGIAFVLGLRVLIGKKRGQDAGTILGTEGLLWGAMAAVVVFLLPSVELTNLEGDPIGMAVRGYGVMLLTAVGAAVGLAAYRAKQRGFDPELIYAVAPWAFCGGILGARVFYVIQYREKFIYDSLGQPLGWTQALINMLKFSEGGLVVYGSFIGGILAGSIYLVRKKLPWLKFGDVIIPCMFLGVFFGRMGCVMNGCCYGGRCEDHSFALKFPPNSPVYHDQIRSGELLGFRYDPETSLITHVVPGSLADEAGIQPDQHLEILDDDRSSLASASRDIPLEEVRTGVFATIDGKRYRWSPDELPAAALPVFAAQILSSVCSLLLCIGLCLVPATRFRDGTVMMLGFASYAILRFVLELVRVDEGGQFGTALSISQWVSVFVFAGSIVGLILIYRAPAGQSEPSDGSLTA